MSESVGGRGGETLGHVRINGDVCRLHNASDKLSKDLTDMPLLFSACTVFLRVINLQQLNMCFL